MATYGCGADLGNYRCGDIVPVPGDEPVILECDECFALDWDEDPTPVGVDVTRLDGYYDLLAETAL